MKLTTTKINAFLFFKLPSAFLCGVRLRELTSEICTTTVTHRWINQNPFNSIYFAVQAMAAELSTGALVMYHIKQSDHQISMLVAQSKSTFTKKATGKISFSCNNGQLIKKAINNAIATGEGQTVWMKSIATNQYREQVSEMDFEWTIKLK